ncbi:MAG: DUF4127 family protein, partial [Candidatus Izemoplasmatales bacterium]|nr:DUF4127 family protein [Candidatus Izemoplasmatales bacterium]
KEHLAFLIKRYIEDIGYCNLVRTSVTKKLGDLGMNYFDVHEQEGKAAKLVEKELQDFIDEHLEELKLQFDMVNVNMPWKRMFEVDFDIEIK